MNKPMKLVTGTELKLFDPRDGSTGPDGAELLDPSVVLRGDQWMMYLAGQAHGHGAPNLYRASLSPGAPLSATGWEIFRAAGGEPASIAGNTLSAAWDGNGGRHCPAYVKGWDPEKRQSVERIYYAGGATNIWGPYAIGYLEWDGKAWVDQPQPAFAANEDWERGSVYEPNLIYHDGKWKMWYVAGSNHEDYLVQGYAESEDGRTGWSQHVIFAPPDCKMFDFCVRRRGECFAAIFARVWVGEGAPPETGLWWSECVAPSSVFFEWSPAVQIMTAEDRGWHSGPWKPSFQFTDQESCRALVFFDGCYRTSDPGPFPYAFTLGSFEIDLPRSSVSVASPSP